MAKYKKMTYRFFVGGRPIEELTAEEREEFANKAAERMGAAFTSYYTAHPEELEKIK